MHTDIHICIYTYTAMLPGGREVLEFLPAAPVHLAAANGSRALTCFRHPGAVLHFVTSCAFFSGSPHAEMVYDWILRPLLAATSAIGEGMGYHASVLLNEC